MNKAVIERLVSMRHSPLHNYIVPGLTSWLIMDNGNTGKIRLFESTRTQHEFITPHSHRFDFSACVVRGSVVNKVWYKSGNGDEYAMSRTLYLGKPGLYTNTIVSVDKYIQQVSQYKEGDWYSMTHNEIHSIQFSRDAIVLFFEGANVTDTTSVLEPWVNHERVPTMKTEPWMFKKGETK